MNLLRLSKKAVSYSSASMTKGVPGAPSRAETLKSNGTPPTRKPGARPAASRIQAGIEDRLHERVAAHDRIAHDEQIGRQAQLPGVVAVDQLDAEGGELIAHRRIDVGVAAGDAVPGVARQGGNAAHERAADTEDVQVHRSILGSARDDSARRRARRWIALLGLVSATGGSPWRRRASPG